MLGVPALERLLERRQLEEPVVLDLALELDQVDRALVAVDQLGVGLEVGAARAVVALVVAGVDVAGVVDALQDLLDGLLVLGSSLVRTKKSLVALMRFDEVLELRRVAVDQLLRRHAQALGRLRDRLAVLVGAR